MNALKTGLLALAVSATAALAQEAMQVWTPLGYQQVTPVTSAATLTIPTGTAGGQSARWARICAETNNVRYRDDGTSPTASVGMVLLKDTCMSYSGSLSAIQFTPATSPAVLDVSYYR